MGLMQTNEGVHMGTDTSTIAATQCEQALKDERFLCNRPSCGTTNSPVLQVGLCVV